MLMDPLPRLEPAEMRKVGKSFKKNTGVAPDGIAMRETLVLSDVALCVLSVLFQIFEMTAIVPPQVAWVVVRLYDKLTGGTRPIGHLPFFYRFHAKCRQPLAAEWEKIMIVISWLRRRAAV